MDNRFKFRAWDKAYKQMIYLGVARNHKLSIGLDGKIYGFEYDDENVPDNDGNIGEYPERFEIMQATGIHAAKSYRGEGEAERLIWEGDVLRDKFGNIYAVKYCNAWAAFQAQKQYGIGEEGKFVRFVAGSQSFIGNDYLEWEIIGTIHDDHSELLGGGNMNYETNGNATTE